MIPFFVIVSDSVLRLDTSHEHSFLSMQSRSCNSRPYFVDFELKPRASQLVDPSCRVHGNRSPVNWTAQTHQAFGSTCPVQRYLPSWHQCRHQDTKNPPMCEDHSHLAASTSYDGGPVPFLSHSWETSFCTLHASSISLGVGLLGVGFSAGLLNAPSPSVAGPAMRVQAAPQSKSSQCLVAMTLCIVVFHCTTDTSHRTHSPLEPCGDGPLSQYLLMSSQFLSKVT